LLVSHLSSQILRSWLRLVRFTHPIAWNISFLLNFADLIRIIINHGVHSFALLFELSCPRIDFFDIIFLLNWISIRSRLRRLILRHNIWLICSIHWVVYRNRLIFLVDHCRRSAGKRCQRQRGLFQRLVWFLDLKCASRHLFLFIHLGSVEVLEQLSLWNRVRLIFRVLWIYFHNSWYLNFLIL
jgi:hypothetical protein